MIDQKNRPSHHWILDIPAWLFVAIVMAISVAGFINQF